MSSNIDFTKYSDQQFFKKFLLSAKKTHSEYLVLKANSEGLTKISEPDYEAAFIEAEKRLALLINKPPQKILAKYSERDTRGHLCVDCFECERGINGNDPDKCSSGVRNKKGHMGSCFNGTLISSLEVL
ncbi:hypothetical protein VXS06_14700 [Photobacterium toruni]|uniref:Uncharacterized protein n=1 Tax=Photobacterium toruni TaxID=1935446 RepID=A0ABU6L8Y0_9GAMM|nr:hypothetical protein [Photobacterium toruni]